MATSYSKKRGKKPQKSRGRRRQSRNKSQQNAGSSSTQAPTEEARFEYYSFPPYPDSEPEAPASPPSTHRGSFSDRIASSVRALFGGNLQHEEPEPEPEPEPVPAVRTSWFLWCAHAYEDPCRCRNQIQPGGGDYCEACWSGRCPGPEPARAYWH